MAKTTTNKIYTPVSVRGIDLDERVVTANVSQVKLGDSLTIRWDIGAEERKTITVHEILLEYYLKITGANAATEYYWWMAPALWEAYELAINDVVVAESTQMEIPHDMMYVQRLLYKSKTYNDFQNVLAEHATSSDYHQPHTTSAQYYMDHIQQTNAVALSGAGYLVQFPLHHFFDIRKLRPHRIYRIELRIRHRNSSTTTLSRYLRYTLGGADTTPNLVIMDKPVFRVRYEKSAPAADPETKPMVLVTPNYNWKDFGKVFATVTEFRFALRQNFPHIKNLRGLYFFLKDLTGPPATDSWKIAGAPTVFTSLVVYKNGLEKRNYSSVVQLKTLWNEQMMNRYGHSMYLQSQRTSSNDGVNRISTNDNFIPYIDLSPLSSYATYGSMNDFDPQGIDIHADDWDIKVTVLAVQPNFTFEVICDNASKAMIDASGKVVVTKN